MKKIQDTQEKVTFQLYFLEICEKLKENFHLIPTKSKIPVEKKGKRKTSIEIDCECALVVPEWLAVVNIDNIKEFCNVFNINKNEIESIATIKAEDSYQIYIYNEKNEIKPFEDLFYKIIGKDNLVMLAGSRLYHTELGKNVYYRVLNPRIYRLEELDGLKFILSPKKTQKLIFR